jgi:glycosyltransferase involved in cell wall biosynthesis
MVAIPGASRMLWPTLRVAIVTTSYPSDAGDPSGHFVRAEAAALAGEGHEVHVVAPAGGTGTIARDDGVRTWPLPHGGAFGWPGAANRLRRHPWRAVGALQFAALASRQLHVLRPERIVAHWLVPCAHPIATSASSAEIDVVVHGADARLLLSLPAPVRAHVVEAVLARTRSIRFAAHATMDALAASLPADLQKRLLVVSRVQSPRITVPDVRASAMAIRDGWGERAVAVTAGRLIRSKRVDVAVRAARYVEPPFVLEVIGDGPDRERLHRVPCDERVLFLGSLRREEALAHIAASDVLVHASSTESAPTVVREARALGTPVVACDAGDVALWARSDTGIHVVPQDPMAIAAAIARVCARDKRPSLREPQ